MNSDKHSVNSQSGNAMIYVILSLALLAALTMVISRQNNQSGAQSLTFEQQEILTTKILAYAGSAKNIIDQMEGSGTNISSMSFVRPNQPSFDVSPHINKVFHPEGGGLNFEARETSIFPSVTVPVSGWYMSGDKNILWTPTMGTDVLLVAYGIGQSFCQNINKKITNATTIPVVTGTFENILLSAADGGGAGTLDMTSCAACNGYPSLCVSNTGATIFAYYNVISAR